MKHATIAIIKILFAILLFNIPFTIKCQDVRKDIYEDIVLEIPPVRITRYEYEKNLNEFINTYKNNNMSNPSDEILNNWRKEFIDKNYLLTELYNRGFDKRQDVLNTVNSMERIILTQDHGLLYDEFVTKKVNISEEAVRVAYERSGKHIKVECLKFPDRATLVLILGENTRIKTRTDFKGAVAKCENIRQIQYDTLEFIWPYFNIDNSIAERIFNLKKDEVLPPTQMMDGICTYYAIEVFSLEKEPFEKIQPMIRGILEETEKTALRNAFYSKIYTVVIFHIDNIVCDRFMSKYDIELFKDYHESSRTQTLNAQFKDVLTDTMLTYSITSQKSYLTVKGFLEHYSSGTMLSIFKNRADLEYYLYKYATEEYMLQLADSLDIPKSLKFQLDKKNYLNKTILSFYEVRELMPQIQVSEEEIENYYMYNQSEFQSGETAEISAFTFDTEGNANNGRMKLLHVLTDNPSAKGNESQLNGLKEVKKNVSVTRNSSSYPTSVLSTVFKLKDNQLSEPIKLANEFIVIQKQKETGSMIKPIEEVRDDILQSMKKVKCDKIKYDNILTAKKNNHMRENKILSNH